MTARRVLAFVLVAAALTACGRTANPPLTVYDKTVGYRYDTVRKKPAEESLFVILAFSGGGTRAAAFSYGVLEGLAAIEYEPPAGPPRTLLDDVDVISSVSGGKLTAAHYALTGTAGSQLEKDFLYRNIQGSWSRAPSLRGPGRAWRGPTTAVSISRRSSTTTRSSRVRRSDADGATRAAPTCSSTPPT